MSWLKNKPYNLIKSIQHKKYSNQIIFKNSNNGITNMYMYQYVYIYVYVYKYIH